MPSGTAPNTSLVLTDAEIDYINTHHNGSKSAAIHKALGAMMNKQTVILNESGYDTGMSFTEYALHASEHGDDPRDYSDNIEDFVFVSVDYAKQDPNWDISEGWPEHLPLWEYRPE